ncbi:MAG: 50S ribosomal protein L1 [Mycoplasmataceae bacterium]|nr:50S ribosomal protein L1 [Mycoplasmataceae bacterium]
MSKLTKNQKSFEGKVDKSKLYPISDAIKLAKDLAFEKFDSTFNVVYKLNVDPRHADQQLRGKIVLPKGTGKTQKILAIVEGENANIAKEMGADFIGGIDLLTKIEKEKWFDFDVIVTTPDMMPKFGKYGKLLGPKGLMPNPKLGTLSPDIKKSISDIKKGSIEYRTDKDGNVATIFGKQSFDDSSLIENFNSILEEINRVKPAKVKGKYILNVSISTAMGPGIKVELN